MVQLTLPQNSRPTPGKSWPKPAAAKRTKPFKVYRWDPETPATPPSTPIISI